MSDAAHTMNAHDVAAALPDLSPPVAQINRYQFFALIAAAVGIIGSLVVAFAFGAVPRLFVSYLIGYVFWVGISIGSLGILMVQHVAGGAWGVTIRRILESSAWTIPLMAILFIPILIDVFATHHLYEWTHMEAVNQDPILSSKKGYLNPGFFAARAIVYFVIWGSYAFFLNRWSSRQDETFDPVYENKMRVWSGPGIVIFALTVTFASVDWVMSLDPHWYSTIFGILFIGGWGLTALSFTIIVLALLARTEPLARILKPSHFHDLGKLLLAFVMLWSYFSISQLLIIWSGNLPEEIPWFLRRLRGGWQNVSIALVLLNFGLPLLLLLSRDIKRNSRSLIYVALLVFIMRFVDVFYLIAPEFYRVRVDYSRLAIHPLDILITVGLGGVWLWWFLGQLKKRAILPPGDPLIEKTLHPKHH